MENHINIIGVLWIVSGILGFFAALFVFGFLFGISFIPDMGYEAPLILRALAVIIGFFIAVFSIPEIIGGVWLMKRREWARILVIVISFFNLLSFPFGTAIGIYSLIILFREDTVQLFEKGKGRKK